MKIDKLHSAKIIFAQLLLLCLPAASIAAYVLWHVNQYYTVLNNQWMVQAIYFSIGLFAGCFFYNHRFRFITTFFPLLFVLYIVSIILDKTITGEFSAFFVSAQFFIFSFLLLLGIVTGWGFARFRYFPMLLCISLLIIQMIVVSKTTDITAQKLIIAFVPVLFFSIYIIYTAELIRNMNADEPAIAWYIGKRLAGFTLISALILFLLVTFFTNEFKAIEKEFGGNSRQPKPENTESLTKENRDGTVSNKKEMGMSGGRKTSKRLVFIAKLDNYLPNSETPNPLYFTYDYYTKFDTLTQTLETDSSMPSNDLFQPDPSKIPLYFTQVDSSVLTKAKGILARKVVTAEVYKALLSPKEFIAPSTAFFCQPISIDKEYQQQFKSAYRAKMYVSDLNSAYFVYNPAGNVSLEDFQKTRFDLLRKIDDWKSEDSAFMHYYTFIPQGEVFDSIRALAQQITKNITSPIDKIVALRDYYLSKDENGQPLFKYTDNPGVPGLPSASKLSYFLFENKKGYCAYFAGATLFLLRALGIPSRVATGFLTVDRANKNKSWYWFYEDQAHAWVQVYFPGYGWLDFDTTIPSTEQQQSPAPDGTPPITVQSAFFVANGKVESIDTSAKRMQMLVTKMIYHDKSFELQQPVTLNMDVSLATVNKDTGAVPLSTLTAGMEITSLSFSEQFKNIIPLDADSAIDILAKIPRPVPIDEIRIADTEKEKQQKKQAQKTKEPFSLLHILWIFLAMVGGILLMAFSLPWLIYAYFRWMAARAGSVRMKAYYHYTSAMYLLNQLGYARKNEPPLAFARERIDATFNTDFSAFVQVYLKSKYSNEPIAAWEEKIIQLFYPAFIQAVKKQVSTRIRFNRFFNIYRTINYFTKPKI